MISNNIDLDNESLFEYVKEIEQVSQSVSNSFPRPRTSPDMIANQEDIDNNKNAEYIIESFKGTRNSTYNSFVWGILVIIVIGLLILIISTGSCGGKHAPYSSIFHGHSYRVPSFGTESLSFSPEFGTGFKAMFVRN